MNDLSPFENRPIQRPSDMLFSHIDDEVVMMSIKTGEYYGLNSVASRIWELLEHPHTFEELIGKLALEFDIDEGICRKDVHAFLSQLAENQLIIAAD